jgi:hypothetical protein
MATKMVYRGTQGDFSQEYSGLVKLRLWHGRGFSLITPDLVLLPGPPARWFQPYSFTANLLGRTEGDISGMLAIDITGGHTLWVYFSDSTWIRRLRDGSDLFHCKIKGPSSLASLADGIALVTPEHEVLLDLFHHTRPDIKKLIEAGQVMRASTWNFQGTKRLKNIAYDYFTSLRAIRSDDDLRRIAMASDGVIRFVRDGFDPPLVLAPDWRERYKADILELPVYRESTTNRTATLPLQVDAAALAPQYLLRHAPAARPVYYEVCNPMIHRVGVLPGTELPIMDGALVTDEGLLKRTGYLVVGDATTLAGLAAPYDEEDTTFILKLEPVSPDSNVLRFWIDHANTDLFSPRKVQLQEFE